ncbi:hypothetical protein CSB09_03430 [Candidatus Gracilibacteria bacterium]|nr:MAG: hypothetical protein CSB09_03430 [Candidatus Gracilibacteria bacterium]
MNSSTHTSKASKKKETLHIKEGGAHINAWENTRPSFLEEYGFDPDFFKNYRTQRKRAEKEFNQWKENKKQKRNSPTKGPSMDLWRRFNLPDEE